MQNARVLLVHRLPRAEQRERRQEAGQHEQQQADAVDADGVADAERRNPRVALDELEVGRRRVEPRPQQQRLGEHQQRHDQRDRSGSAPRSRSSSRTNSSSERADDRQRRSSEVRIGNGISSSRHVATGSTRGSAPRRGTATRRTRAPNRSAARRSSSLMPPTVSPTPLTAPSMTADVDALPQPLLRHDANRLHDGRVVDLVDVVLVRAARGAGRRTVAPRGRPRRAVPAGRRTPRGRCPPTRDERSRRAISASSQRSARVAAACSPAGRVAPSKLGSRNCSKRFDPPSACGSPT